MTQEQIRAAGGRFDPERYYRYMDHRTWSLYLFALATGKLVPVPNRRRRKDREVPKAA